MIISCYSIVMFIRYRYQLKHAIHCRVHNRARRNCITIEYNDSSIKRVDNFPRDKIDRLYIHEKKKKFPILINYSFDKMIIMKKENYR